MKLVSYSVKGFEITVEKEHNVFVVNKFKIGYVDKIESIKTPSLDIAMELFYELGEEIQSREDNLNG